MFEDSTFESNGVIHTRSSTWSLAALAVNGAALAAIIVLPLIFPDALPHRWINTPLTPPAAMHERENPEHRPADAAPSHPRFSHLDLSVPIRISRTIDNSPMPDRGEQEMGQVISLQPAGSGIPGGDIFRSTPTARVQPAPRPNVPVPVSQGVAAGLLLQKTLPVYPSIAVAARVEGIVVLSATISRSGSIEELRVLSGPAMLQRAALDAVRNWRYRPYLLNGSPWTWKPPSTWSFRWGVDQSSPNWSPDSRCGPPDERLCTAHLRRFALGTRVGEALPVPPRIGEGGQYLSLWVAPGTASLYPREFRRILIEQASLSAGCRDFSGLAER